MANENEFEHSIVNFGLGRGRGGWAGGDDYVTKYEADLIQKLADQERQNAILRAENDTDKKLVDVYAKLEGKINREADTLAAKIEKVAADLEDARRHQETINREQAVYNGVNNAIVNELRRQIGELTDLYIPARKVTPLPMERFNKWETPITGQQAAAPATTAQAQ